MVRALWETSKSPDTDPPTAIAFVAATCNAARHEVHVAAGAPWTFREKLEPFLRDIGVMVSGAKVPETAGARELRHLREKESRWFPLLSPFRLPGW